MKRNLVILLVLLASFFSVAIADAQTKLSFNGNHLSCANTNIEIPIIGENISDATSFTLNIHIDTTNIIYIKDTTAYVNDIFKRGVFKKGFNKSLQNIVLTWMSPGFYTAEMENDTICIIELSVKNPVNEIPLVWVEESCEMSNSALGLIENIEYENAYLYNNQQSSTLTINPVQQEIFTQNEAVIEVNHIFSNVEQYHWQIKENDIWENLINNSTYQGVTSKKITIFANDTILNGKEYRCIISTNTCNMASSVSLLNVKENDGFEILQQENHKILIYNREYEKYGEIFVEAKQAFDNFTVQVINMKGQMLLNKKIKRLEAYNKIGFSTEKIKL